MMKFIKIAVSVVFILYWIVVGVAVYVILFVK